MNELPEASFFDVTMIFLGYRFKYIVEGNSMLPILEDGDKVLANRNAKVEVGDIVIAKHPDQKTGEIIKRVERINEKGHHYLVGDNLEESNDSRHFGAVSIEYIKGKVIACLK